MIFKKEQFAEFLKLIEEDNFPSWIAVAEALNVNKNTITAWKNTDEGQKAIAKGIKDSLAQMEKAGSKDWRMWESKLKILGVIPTQKVEAKHDLTDPAEEVLRKLGLLGDENAGEVKKLEDTTPQSDS